MDESPGCCNKLSLTVWQTFHRAYDRLSVHTNIRWAITFSILLVYTVRVILNESYHIVSYALAIYYLSAFISFLTPKMANVENEDEDDPVLPMHEKDEFRPFLRQLPEIQFWQGVTLWSLLAFLCTFSEAFNVPVYWPILVLYFFILLVFTMRRQLAHMAKHNYVPWSVGKRVYP